MYKRYLWIGLFTVGLVVAGCDQADDTTPPTPETRPDQAVEGEGLQTAEARNTPERRPDMPPEETLTSFFRALQEEQLDQAGGHIARSTLSVSEEQLRSQLEAMAQNVARGEEPFAILDVEQEGQFAIAATRFTAAEANGPEIRPIVLMQEEGEWRVVWELIGQDPARAADMSELAQRIEPLYEWYTSRETELQREIVAGQDSQDGSAG